MQIFAAFDEAKFSWKSLNWGTCKKAELVKLAAPELAKAKWLPRILTI
jgi:hypothetical protein